jgi:predicted nucleic acid-binding protein
MIYLLDSNVLSELRRPKQMSRNVRDWFAGIDVNDAGTSAIVIMELEYGAARAAYRKQPHAPMLRDWIDNYVLPRLEGRILPVDTAVAARCAQLQVPKTRPYGDALIAATALVNNLTVVTRNVRHFEGMDVKLLNPWTHSP